MFHRTKRLINAPSMLCKLQPDSLICGGWQMHPIVEREPVPIMLCNDCRFLSGHREKAREVASEKDGVLILTWANHEYHDFVLNWLSHMERIKVTAYLVGAMDNNLLKVPSNTQFFPSRGSKAQVSFKERQIYCLPAETHSLFTCRNF